MAINTALQNQTCLIGRIGQCDHLQLIAAGRVIVCLTQDPRVVLRYQHDSSGVKRIDSARCIEITRRCIARQGMPKVPTSIPGLVSDNPTDGRSMKLLEDSLWLTASSLHKKQRIFVQSVHFIKCTGLIWGLRQELQFIQKDGQNLLRSWEALRRR